MRQTVCSRARHMIRCFREDRSGATAVEYAVIGAFLSVVIYGSAISIGTKLGAMITAASGNLAS
jgi:Flp pilus assembly pilin Flp